MKVTSEPSDLSARGALGTEDAAVYTGIARATLKKWRVIGEGPPYVRAGSKILYLVEDLNSWLRERRVP